MWALCLLLLLLVFGIYKFLTANYGYWRKRGVPHPPPVPLFGNFIDAVLVRRSLGQLYSDIYNDYPNLSYVGVYKMRQPAVLVRDPELIQNVFIKEFSSFHDNDIEIDQKVDPLLGRNPFVLKGDRWKTVRNQLIPTFTSKKLKSMFPLIQEVGKKMIWYLNESAEASGKDGLETKELASKFTTDVVASCAFGLEGRSFEDEKPEFREIFKTFLTPSFTTALKFLCVFIFPSLATVLKIKAFPDNVGNYFRRIVSETMKYREKNNIVRGDFLDLMKEFKSKLGEHEFNDEDIVAHAAGFFIDGFETSSFALSYALFELASNPYVQNKLRNEINVVLAKNGGELTYDDLHEITYLDNILHESLRKFPPVQFMTKRCTKSFEFPSPFGEEKGRGITVEPGTPIIIPSYAVQHDSKYYPDPEKFDPSRFAEENESSRTKCTFLSFGEGPRICLGKRFAVTQVKVAIASIISNFEVRLNKKTVVPLQMDPQYFLLKAKDGIWLNFYKLKK